MQHVIEINNWRIINANMSVKSIALGKKIIVRILAHEFVRIIGI